MLPFHLTVLGPPELRAPDGEPVRLRTRKHLALLVYLAMEQPRPQRREVLSNLLWSDVDPEIGRHSLATALCMLRARMGGDAFECTRDTVRLLPGHLSNDIELLLSDDVTRNAGVSLGPLLEDFEIDDAPVFQHWKDVQRARLLPLLYHTMVRRIDHARRHGDTRSMEAIASQMLRIDDLSEEAVRAQLEARAMAGDRIGALRLYEHWRTRLDEELGAEPSQAFARMAQRLRRGQLDNFVSASIAITDQARQRTFVGRGAEFLACYQAWERMRSGSPGHLLIRGDTGVGKTTLVDRVASALALEGVMVVRVKGYELERELPFGVIGAMVSQLLDLPGASGTAPEQLAELARIVPKVKARYGNLPDPIPSTGESSRILFTEAVLALIGAIAEDHPIMVVVDDMHLSDITSLAVMHLMLRRAEELPLMMVLTSSLALHQESPEARRFADNAAVIGVTPVHLDPLNEAESAELLDALVAQGAAPSPTLRRALLAGARGNPMVLELLVADWRRRGDECVAFTLGSMTSVSAVRTEDAFKRVVEQTLASLDPEARSVAELGAILGQRLNDVGMYTLLDLPTARTMRAMTSLTSHHVLRDAGNTLYFTNEFVRGQCYLGMSAPLRRMLHGGVADRLLTQDGADAPIPGLEIAWHLVRADRLAEAVPYLLAGGREAIQRAAPHESDLALRTGLPALTGQPRRTAILLLAEAQQELGRWADSLQLLDMAREDFSESEECSREVFRIIARRWLGAMSEKESKSSVETLFSIAERKVDSEVRVRALAACPPLLDQTRDKDQLNRLESLSNSIDLGTLDNYGKLHLLIARAWPLARRQDTKAALGILEYGVELAERASVTCSITVRLLLGLGNVLAVRGRYKEACVPLHRAREICKKMDNNVWLAYCTGQLAMIEGRLGNVEAQIDWARQSIKLVPDSTWSFVTLASSYELGLGLALLGRYNEAENEAVSLCKLDRRDTPNWARQTALLFAADIRAACGRKGQALKTAVRATTGANERPLNLSFAGQFSRWVAMVALHNRRQGAARKRLNACFPEPVLLDAKDQLELLAAMTVLDTTTGSNARKDVREIQKRLTELPPGVRRIMRSLEALPSVLDDRLTPKRDT